MVTLYFCRSDAQDTVFTEWYTVEVLNVLELLRETVPAPKIELLGDVVPTVPFRLTPTLT